jgi:pimeloyl-ACP methyl ester carboxylesterase
MGRRVEENPANLLGDAWEVDEADKAVLSRADVAAVTREATAELVAGGHWGWVDDDLAFITPWGFDVSEIRVPVEVRYGVKDVLVPAAHGAWLGRHVPGARVVVESDEGHLSDPDRLVEQMRWVVSGG